MLSVAEAKGTDLKNNSHEIQAAELTQPQIDLSKIEKGLYFLQIENQQGIVKNLKVIKK